MKRALILLPILLTACGETTQSSPRPATIAPPPIKVVTGVDHVMGKDARSLVSLFGPAVQDVREESARKLQFAGPACILDTYLYPPSKGREPIVTYLTARVPDGRDADKSSCVNALIRK